MKSINTELLNRISEEAIKNPRKRMNYNFHENGEELLQRMLNALEPGTYLPPHRHTEKVEVFLLLRGKIQVLLFDDSGEIIEVKPLNPISGGYGVEIPAGIWHTIMVEDSGSVIYEIKEGPYVPGVGVEFASWAPKPEAIKDVENYMDSLNQKIKNLK
ncbi:WbuC family cupin fold metalloprotein [Ancylomarina longa]|uniref:Cupin fold metalloprotein, WbuC family n=1 Tax=Ancylomarina longa TaxID=2487017 RepID=A0A434B0B1_9BACT|nr:WbuC family cupin fold metalloprotein [Ancylomarina longa]RUT80195.1 cupin fold metalloprotein, WbuC family [Ancylomarina longa]